MNAILRRREFLFSSASVAAFTLIPRHVLGGPGLTPPSEMLNVAVIGAGGQGFVNVKELLRSDEAQVVAVADPASATDYSKFYYGGLAGRKPVAAYVNGINKKRGKEHLKCAEHVDYRKMLPRQANDIDAVLVAAPDHAHAVAATAALKMGKHAYCEKPLAHDLHEVRVTTEVARATGAAEIAGADYDRWHSHWKNGSPAPDRTIDFLFLARSVRLGTHFFRQRDPDKTAYLRISDHFPVIAEITLPAYPLPRSRVGAAPTLPMAATGAPGALPTGFPAARMTSF